MDSPKYQYPNTAVPANKKAPPAEGVHYTKNGGMWNLKHKIISPKFYETLINAELKLYIALETKNSYNITRVCLNAVNRLR